jgi:ATP-dependent helicase HrpB
LWEEAANGALLAFAPAEILNADLSGLVLDLTAWGVNTASDLQWLDPPPAAALNQAHKLLNALGAFDDNGRLSATGQGMRHLPLPPRLARMVIDGARQGQAALSAELAAVIVERGLGGDDIDLCQRLRRWRGERGPRSTQARAMARHWARQAQKACGANDDMSTPDIAFEQQLGPLLALAFPDRIAKARGSEKGEFVMSNGRAGVMPAHESLANSPYLVIADLTGRAARARITAAVGMDEETCAEHAAHHAQTTDEIQFDSGTQSLRARRVRRLGGLILHQQPLPVPADEHSAAMLAEALAHRGIERLAFSKEQQQWRDRLMFLRRMEGEEWPDVSDQALATDAQTWLAPFLIGLTAAGQVNAELLGQALAGLLPWQLKQRLEDEAPRHFIAPTGNHFAIDYRAEGGPMVEVRVQEVYGLNQHPHLAGGRVPLTLTLTSPAHRPLQITRDLPRFWAGSWAEVRAQMKGRYPRHVWPDDPAHAAPTARAKPRGS